MKQRLLLLTIILFSLSAFSANIAETDKRVVQLEERVEALSSEIGTIRTDVMTLSNKMSGLQVSQDSTQAYLNATNDEVVSVKNELSQKASALGDSIVTTNDKLGKTSKDLHLRSIFGLFGILASLIIAGLIYYILRNRMKKGITAIECIKEAQNKLNEESIKLDNQLVEIINKQLDVQKEMSKSAVSTSDKMKGQNHSLALKVADEIVRIELNLSRMDSNVRGYKQLSKAVERIKNNFLAQGYEIVDMLGKPYNDGMKVVASFVSDESLSFGEQVITGITKPQINYNGEMIQAAQITVSQNI